MALVGVELKTLVSEPDALTTRPLPCKLMFKLVSCKVSIQLGSFEIEVVNSFLRCFIISETK